MRSVPRAVAYLPYAPVCDARIWWTRAWRVRAWWAPSRLPTRPAGENTVSGEPVEEARQGPGSDVRSGRALPAPGRFSDLVETF